MNTNEFAQSKIFHFSKEEDLIKLKRHLAFWKFKNQSIVFTNGCFDIIHLGHIDYLSKAADNGNILIIGLNTDKSVKNIKGEKRPINNEETRALFLASLFFVDAVVLFDEDTPYELIKTITPDILIKGSDYKAEEIVGNDIVKSKGGKIITIDFLEGYSTTSIIEKIKLI
ncbi:MAG TPA: D-glycero-beta-D-manno-heptose 1-phosphate adenylyltransferase [Bacteroidales bacterium]|nr:D-glycero-beta-D-manno-heptose 1-phosphate adenylyltransferase [Bacteroidales bacterium]HPS15755.1 D-glycero-beta-D-manno-heptose 1-phosphate adenylyltransferase [Bacteroidales bacterium]